MSKVVITQVRSDIGCAPVVRQTIKALGLGKLGKTRQIVSNDAVNGMLKRVAHLIEVKPVK